MRHCLHWETLSWFLDALFCPFSFPSNYPFGRGRFPLPNEYLAWRTVHCHRKGIEGTQHIVAQFMYRCGQRCSQRGYKHQMWHNVGRGLVKDNRACLSSKNDDCSTSPTIQKPQLDLASGRPREMETTPQILVQTHKKSALRPSRIWTRCSTIKYREILDAS